MQKINFEDIQFAIKNPDIYLFMNTLPINEQHCLLINTIPANKEESIMNRYMKQNKGIQIILYGRNCNDETIYKKYNQLLSLGFSNVYLYFGGMFEWLMLQDIYGEDEFPTTKKELDILKYKPNKRLNIPLIDYPH